MSLGLPTQKLEEVLQRLKKYVLYIDHFLKVWALAKTIGGGIS